MPNASQEMLLPELWKLTLPLLPQDAPGKYFQMAWVDGLIELVTFHAVQLAVLSKEWTIVCGTLLLTHGNDEIPTTTPMNQDLERLALLINHQ